MIRVVLAVAATAAALSAQFLPVEITGRVQRLAATACDPAATHRVECSDVLLRSAAVDLRALEGATVDLAGTLFLGPGCVTVDVASATPAASRTTQLALFGYRIGRSFAISTFAPPGALVATVFSADTAFLPLGPLGALCIDPITAVIAGIDISIGLTLRTVQIPNDPSLVGAVIWYQAVSVELAPALAARFLNPNCFTIRQ